MDPCESIRSCTAYPLQKSFYIDKEIRSNMVQIYPKRFPLKNSGNLF